MGKHITRSSSEVGGSGDARGIRREDPLPLSKLFVINLCTRCSRFIEVCALALESRSSSLHSGTVE